MIYLIQDCYKDEDNNYIDILKIGYSEKPFMESRNNQYKTHNYGYKFIGEREGDTKFEHYLHEKFKSFRLSNDSEWFIYNSSIISEFFTIDENEKNIILTKEQYISNIQFYLIQNLTKPEELYKRYKEAIVDDLKKEFTIEDNEELSCIYNRIKETFNRVYEITYREIKENCNIGNHFFDDVPNLIRDTWLECNPWKNQAELYYKTNTREKSQEEFKKELDKKYEQTLNLIQIYNETSPALKHSLAEKYQSDAVKSTYKKDYVAVNSHMGSDLKPVFNKLAMISEKRSFKIQQYDYKDRFSVFNSLKKKSDVEDIDKYIDMIKSIPDTAEKYKYFCSLPEIISISMFPYLPSSFQNYYTVLGPGRMQALWYDVTKMRKEYERIMENQGVDIKTAMLTNFSIGDKISKSEVKNKLKSLYDSIGYSKTPKGTDLGDYFIIKNCKIPKSDGTRDNGYEILAIKT
jgi:hypothetical protein